MEQCPFCFSIIQGYVHVAGHEQCPRCNQIVEGCCSGEAIWIEGENCITGIDPYDGLDLTNTA